MVIYIKTGYETMACVKPLDMFLDECKLGERLVLRGDVLEQLYELQEEDELQEGDSKGAGAGKSVTASVPPPSVHKSTAAEVNLSSKI